MTDLLPKGINFNECPSSWKVIGNIVFIMMRTIQYVADCKFLLHFPVLIYENEAVLTCVAINMS